MESEERNNTQTESTNARVLLFSERNKRVKERGAVSLNEGGKKQFVKKARNENGVDD